MSEHRIYVTIEYYSDDWRRDAEWAQRELRFAAADRGATLAFHRCMTDEGTDVKPCADCFERLDLEK